MPEVVDILDGIDAGQAPIDVFLFLGEQRQNGVHQLLANGGDLGGHGERHHRFGMRLFAFVNGFVFGHIVRP